MRLNVQLKLYYFEVKRVAYHSFLFLTLFIYGPAYYFIVIEHAKYHEAPILHYRVGGGKDRYLNFNSSFRL